MARNRRPVRLEYYPIEYLGPNPYQPRLTIDPADLNELIASIERFGFTGYLEARRDPGHPGRKLQIVFGHRRLAAAEAAGLRLVPVVIVDRTDQDMADQSFIENRTHKQLKPWDEAVFLQRYQDQHGTTMRDLGRNLGVSKGFIQNRLDLLKIPADSPIRTPLEQGTLDMATSMTLHALAQQRPSIEIAQLVSQVQAGTLTNKDLAGMKAGSMPATPASPSAMPAPPLKDQSTPTPRAPSKPVTPQDEPNESTVNGETMPLSSKGRFADLTRGDDPVEQRSGPNPTPFQIIPCGEDDDALMASGLLTPDGLDLRLEPAATRAAYRFVHHVSQALDRMLPAAEAYKREADFDSLSPRARQTVAGIQDRFEQLFEGIWTEEG